MGVKGSKTFKVAKTERLDLRRRNNCVVKSRCVISKKENMKKKPAKRCSLVRTKKGKMFRKCLPET